MAKSHRPENEGVGPHTQSSTSLCFITPAPTSKSVVLQVRKVVAVGGREPRQRVWSFRMVSPSQCWAWLHHLKGFTGPSCTPGICAHFPACVQKRYSPHPSHLQVRSLGVGRRQCPLSTSQKGVAAVVRAAPRLKLTRPRLCTLIPRSCFTPGSNSAARFLKQRHFDSYEAS